MMQILLVALFLTMYPATTLAQDKELRVRWVVTVAVTTLAGDHPNSPFLWTKKSFQSEAECAAELVDGKELRVDLGNFRKVLRAAVRP